MKWRDKCDQLMADNRLMTKKLIYLNSKLLIWEQKYLSIETAFDLSQKLVQHLKTENQLLRSSTDLLSMNNPLDQSMTHSLAITESTPNCDNRDIVATDDIYAEVHKPNEDLCKSDLIAIQYEKEIKEFEESLSLLSCLPIESVVITLEDQLNANRHLCSASESEEECEEQMDVDINGILLNSESNQFYLIFDFLQKCQQKCRKHLKRSHNT